MRATRYCFSTCALMAAAAVVLSTASAAETPRTMLNIDSDWRFLQQDVADAEKPPFDDTPWRCIDVPHDGSIEGPYAETNTPQNAWLPVGVGWYRKTFVADADWSGKKVLLRFDGIYMNSRVWLNGQPVGGRPYGFISFDCDLTPHLRPGRNVIAVRVDNAPAPTSRFYHGGGIYGHVNLLTVPPLHVAPLGGVFVRTREANANQALLTVNTELRHDGAQPATARIQQTLWDAQGNRVAVAKPRSVVVSPGTAAMVAQELSVGFPHRWSPTEPYLYRLETRVEQDGTLIDRVTTSCGIRTARFDANTGFWLNDQNIKLQGMCEHQELAPVGLAAPDALIEWRLRLLKGMGCNAIRTAHNPFTPAFYDLCDKMGILVMDEIFDGWKQKGANDYGGRFFKEWWRRDVEDFVRRDRNHPSVVVWSVGNETGKTDTPGISKHIAAFDDSRLVTGGTVFFGVSLSGFNGPGETPTILEAFHQKYPDQPVVLTEAPHTIQTRGFYRVLTWWRDKGNPRFSFPPYGTEEIFSGGSPWYYSSYDNAGVRMCARDAWRRTATTPWISGEFRWTGFDCLGEAQFMGAEFPKRCYSSGVIDLAGFPKDQYYFYQSQWTKEPMVHLLPHWTHPDLKPGTVVPVVAYSNCEEVELLLNGRSLGRKQPNKRLECVWHVPYEPGELKGIGRRQGQAMAKTVFRTAHSPLQLKLETEAASPDSAKTPDGVTLLTVSARDETGALVPWANNRVEFRLLGPVRLLGFENGDPIDGTSNRASWRRLFYGLARGYFHNTSEQGPVEIIAAAILGERLFQHESRVAITATHAALRGDLLPTDFVIHYTTDGSEPTAQSPRYAKPFTLTTSAKVRALVLRDGQPLMKVEDEFKRGAKPVWADMHFERPPTSGNVSSGRFDGPFDKEVVGRWKMGDQQFVFKADGAVDQVVDGKETSAAWWWYDFPDDRLEAGKNAGTGELRWMKSGATGKLRLASQEAKTLILDSAGRRQTFVKTN